MTQEDTVFDYVVAFTVAFLMLILGHGIGCSPPVTPTDDPSCAVACEVMDYHGCADPNCIEACASYIATGYMHDFRSCAIKAKSRDDLRECGACD